MKGNTAASVRAVGLSALQRPLLLGRQTGSSVSALLPGSVVHDHNRRSFFSQHKRWQTRMEADTFFKKEYTCDFSTGGGPSSATTSPRFDGLVVGVYSNGKLTPTAKQLDEQSGGEISRRLKLSKAMKGEVGNSLLLLNVAPEVPRVVLVGLGKDPEQKGQQPASADDNETEKTCLDEDHADAKEDPVDAVRQAAGTGAKCLRTHGSTTVGMEAFPHVQASAEGAFLGLHKYDDLKSKKTDKVEVSPISHDTEQSESLWNTGKTIAEAQNFARTLAEAPANRMTPSIFVETVQQKFRPLMEQHAEKLKIIAHDKNWAEEEKMGCFLGVAAGSDEPPRFLEIHYNGAPSSEQQPIVLVGKGVTFDSGGISIKPSANMGDMRGDMGGAAAVVASVYGIASLNLPVNVIALTPLCGNFFLFFNLLFLSLILSSLPFSG
ncbi:Cytosol aminopeptidase [Balamuthia mandrillaris]